MNYTIACLAASSLALNATAQTTFDGDVAGARLGAHFDVIPDINGDGVNDLIAGFPEDDTQGTDAGRVLLLSGMDGSTLRQHFGENAGDRFGQNVSRGGELDGDSVGDYLIAATEWGASKGAVYAFSGMSGAPLLFMRGFNDDDKLGTSIDRAGDVDGDGTGDVLVGAPGVDSPAASGHDAGVVYVVSGATGLPIHTIASTLPFNSGLGFGQFVSYIGDVNADGKDDIYGAGPNLDEEHPYGYVGIFSGADGSLLHSQVGFDDAHGFANHVGNGIASPGDVTGDGIPEYARGQVDYMSLYWNLHEGHSIAVYDGATNALLAHYGYFTNNPNTSLLADIDHLIDVVSVGDVDGDGLGDLAYQSPDQEVVRIVSAASTEVIGILPAPLGGLGFGASIRGIDDVTGDGLRDIAIGMPGYDGSAGPEAGRIVVYSGVTCFPPSNYCSPMTNSTGSWAFMGSAGSTSVSANNFVLQAVGCPANKPGLFFYGPNQVSVPAGDGRLCVGAGGLGLFRVKPVVTTDNSGFAARALDLTTLPASGGAGQISPGDTWNFQFWFRDPAGGPADFNFSGGLEVKFCQ